MSFAVRANDEQLARSHHSGPHFLGGNAHSDDRPALAANRIRGAVALDGRQFLWLQNRCVLHRLIDHCHPFNSIRHVRPLRVKFVNVKHSQPNAEQGGLPTIEMDR